jgi:hypothetical protein
VPASVYIVEQLRRGLGSFAWRTVLSTPSFNKAKRRACSAKTPARVMRRSPKTGQYHVVKVACRT